MSVSMSVSTPTESFSKGDIVTSKNTFQIVRVIRMSDCGEWFEGLANPNLPANFQYVWKEWRAESFCLTASKTK